MKPSKLFWCTECNAMVATDDAGILHPCPSCSAHVFRPIAAGFWKATKSDRRWLQSLRIAADDPPPLQPAKKATA